MKTYQYITETIAYAVSRKNLNDRLNTLINDRGAQGWRLVKFDFSDALGACVVVFEKENEN